MAGVGALKERANEATLAEAAEILGVAARTLYWAVFRGEIPAKGRRKPAVTGRPAVVIDLEEADAWVAARKDVLRDGKLPARWRPEWKTGRSAHAQA